MDRPLGCISGVAEEGFAVDHPPQPVLAERCFQLALSASIRAVASR